MQYVGSLATYLSALEFDRPGITYLVTLQILSYLMKIELLFSTQQ
uniref:Uncharacterized protein n=1 Tax=Arundo donax TaxID=35708 RepID=A0A0A9A1H4_ARUDO